MRMSLKYIFLVLATSVLLAFTSCQSRFVHSVFGDKKLHYANFQVDSLTAIVEVLVDDTTGLAKKLRRTSRKYDEISGEHEALKKKYYHLMEESLSKTDILTQALKERTEELKKKEELIRKRERALSNLKNIVRDRDSATTFLYDTLGAILWDFSTEEIHLEKKNGVLELTLFGHIMFDPGSASLYGKGTKVLQRISPLLKEYDNVGIEIEGHTDSIPIRTNTFSDNWDLSTGRALSVMRYMQALGINKNRFTATGKADNEPIASNRTEEGRKQNNRIVLGFSILGDELEQTRIPSEFLEDQLGKRGIKEQAPPQQDGEGAENPTEENQDGPGQE